MPLNLSIKNVPESLANAIRQRAAANHRSLQGELMALLEGSIYQRNLDNAASQVSPQASAFANSLANSFAKKGDEVTTHTNYSRSMKPTIAELDARFRQIAPIVETLAPGASAAEMVRAMRDGRNATQVTPVK